MKVWKVNEPNSITLDDLGSSQVRENCVKLKMLYAPLSNTEKSVYAGESGVSYPRVLGRCGVGMVSEVAPDVKRFKRGDVVYVSSLVTCGECYYCRLGRKAECTHLQTHGKDVDGVLSDFAVVPTGNLYLLPPKLKEEDGEYVYLEERVKDQDAVFVETIAVAIHTLSTLHITKGDQLVIVGASVFGLILAQVALYYQAVPIVVDSRKERLALAEQEGIYYTVNANDDVEKKIFYLTGGKMAGHAVCCLDDAKVKFVDPFRLVASYGRVGLVETDSLRKDLQADFRLMVDKSITAYGINHATENITAAINMLANKEVNVASLARVVEFKDVPDSLEKLKAGEDTLQIVVKF